MSAGTTFALAASLVLLMACRSEGDGIDDPSQALVDARESYYAALARCGLATAGRAPLPFVESLAGTRYLTCYERCFTGGSCADLEALFCHDDGPLLDACADVCEPPDFTCDDGDVISGGLVCDRELDCAGGEDEHGCPVFTCDDGEDIPEDLRCDGSESCDDGSDERDCPAPPTFTCTSGETIFRSLACSDEPDCADGSDEAGCAETRCE